MDLRAFAREQPCMVRVPGVCNRDTQTTVLAHARIIGISGAGLKVPDLLAAWCCSACHAYCDTRHDAETQAMFLRGVLRTQYALIKLKLIHWQEEK
jgi:Protein of unknown function (DUF1364)